MEEANLRFNSKALRPTESSERYSLYRAGLEWDLLDPIVIEKREDLKSELRWKDRLEPYHHQVSNLITFCRRLPVTLLADDVGLGKTISAGLIISELISRGRVSKILIVCPKLLLPQWHEELDKKFGIDSVLAVGSKLKTAEPPEDIGAVITTYHSARLYINDIAKAGYDMLILDEAHKLRNLYGVDKPPQVAQQFRKALADRLFKYVLMLTATPIQNRLWDLYSLVDLLTVARGHQNPFGSEGIFARKFIADNRAQARQLNQENKDEFRSVVYGYMSRIRRGDVDLSFPERKVELHATAPTQEELELIDIIAKPIQKLNRLAQISILQALISSPHALSAQLNNMDRKGTIPPGLAAAVKLVVDKPFLTAKLKGLGALVEKLRRERPDHWRMIVFTGRRETQTTIQAHLESMGIKCGIINGDSADRNQATIEKLRQSPPAIHVIISTDAGSEGVNLQAANVLVNYDLPWNPMIVEQRIGRIQRLASEHANVSVFNVVLRGTFEEYIVGRLMEKLQMASQAIGDIEALLEASGIGGEDDEESDSFEEKILNLVLASLNGKNVEEATQKAEQSIKNAKSELEREQKNIDDMLGGMGDPLAGEPQTPHLPPQAHAMDERSFTLAAVKAEGKQPVQKEDNVYLAEGGGRREWLCFDPERAKNGGYPLYKQGSPAFTRLVSKITSNSLHEVEDKDGNPKQQAEEIGEEWVSSFGGTHASSQIDGVQRCFEGSALVRVRATVAHDSYERLVEVPWTTNLGQSNAARYGLDVLNPVITSPLDVGIDEKELAQKAKRDPGIEEFCRFYSQRKVREVAAAGGDERKSKKLEDDFTPRLELELVGLKGALHRIIRQTISYSLISDQTYASILTVNPSGGSILYKPSLGTCEVTQKTVPVDCLALCAVSNKRVISELLVRSEVSGKRALPEYSSVCSLTGKRALTNELDTSDVTGEKVIRSLLKTSAMSGKRGEPQYFDKCDFTSSDLLKSELAISQVSGKRYRTDEALSSEVSGKTGHKQEFIHCAVTNKLLLPSEAERCELTGKVVIPGILEECELTGKKVLPSELEKSAISGRKALKKFLVSSSLSGARMLEQEAIRSVAGAYCAPIEAQMCHWGGQKCHPDDIRVGELTGLTFHFKYIAKKNGHSYLAPLSDLLDGMKRRSDEQDLWQVLANKASSIIGSKHCSVEQAELSPDKEHIAVCLQVKSLMGLKTRHAGFLYSVKDGSIEGRVRVGKRDARGWVVS